MKTDSGDFVKSLKPQYDNPRFTLEEALDPDVTMEIMQTAVDKAIAQKEALGLVKEESLQLVYPEHYSNPMVN